MAHDEGFEYRSPSFNANLNINITDFSSDDIYVHFGDDWQGYDGLTDNVTIPDAVKFASYVSARLSIVVTVIIALCKFN